jgi:hypothetical protein
MPLSLNKNRNRNGTFLTKNLPSNFLNPPLRARPFTPIGDPPPPSPSPPEDIHLERFNFHHQSHNPPHYGVVGAKLTGMISSASSDSAPSLISKFKSQPLID